MKKFSALVLAVLMVLSVVSFSSCAKKDTGETIQKGVLLIGVDDSYPPMEYQDGAGNLVGFDVDMTKEICKRINLEPKFLSTAWDGIFQALKTDKFDTIISSVSMQTDRIKNYEFTKPYIANSQMIVVKPGDNSITKAEDLKDKIVGCQISTTSNESATYLLETKKISFTLKTYDQVIQPFNDMKAGRLDAIIVDEVVGQYYIGTDNKSFKAAAAKLNNEPMAACFKKGNKLLRDKVQKAMDDMIADGTMKTISQKWFNSDQTSNIDTKLKALQ